MNQEIINKIQNFLVKENISTYKEIEFEPNHIIHEVDEFDGEEYDMEIEDKYIIYVKNVSNRKSKKIWNFINCMWDEYHVFLTFWDED